MKNYVSKIHCLMFVSVEATKHNILQPEGYHPWQGVI